MKMVALYMRVVTAEQLETPQKVTIEKNCKIKNITVDLYSMNG